MTLRWLVERVQVLETDKRELQAEIRHARLVSSAIAAILIVAFVNHPEGVIAIAHFLTDLWKKAHSP